MGIDMKRLAFIRTVLLQVNNEQKMKLHNTSAAKMFNELDLHLSLEV